MIDKYTVFKSLELIENALLDSIAGKVPFYNAAKIIFNEIRFLRNYIREN